MAAQGLQDLAAHGLHAFLAAQGLQALAAHGLHAFLAEHGLHAAKGFLCREIRSDNHEEREAHHLSWKRQMTCDYEKERMAI